MTLGIALVLILVLYIVFDTYKRIERERYLRTRYPEHMRDRNKPLQVGQVWEEGGWKSRITAISGDQVEHDDYVPTWYDGAPQFMYHLHSTVKEYRKLIRFHHFHLAAPGEEHPVWEPVNVKDRMEPPL